jgi:signal peptidase I
VNLEEQTPVEIDARPVGRVPAIEPDRYLVPAEGGEISVREVHYGGKSIAHELIEAVVLSLLIFLLVQSVVQNRKVVGHSMDPTLHDEEHLLIDRASYFRYDTNFFPRLLGTSGLPDNEQYLLNGPQRGDIIVFRPPVDEQDYIKRVIAVAGERVEVRAYDGVYVNGHKLDEPYIKDTPDYNWPAPGQSGVVPAGHVFVLGDNRRNSSDSHAWGFLDDNSIVGKAWISYWPREVFGFLPHPTYAGSDPTHSGP